MTVRRARALVRRVGEALRNRLPTREDLIYVVEGSDWVIDHHGRALIGRFEHTRARLVTTAIGARGRVVHYGSIHTFAPRAGRWSRLHPSNRVVVTWFHITEDDARRADIPGMSEAIDVWHTSCAITRDALVALGAPSAKIRVVPLGVDTTWFQPADDGRRQRIRAELGFAPGTKVVGSFQKDGVGWGDGMEPKLIKGPDILCDALERVAREVDVAVLLTGPSRGYVKQRLDRAAIPYVHRQVQRPEDVAPLYHALDLYVCSSRIEGGPLGLIEAMASGVAVASTPVGMAEELVVHRTNGMIARAGALAEVIAEVLVDDDLRRSLAARARAATAALDWQVLARRYEAEIYASLGPRGR